MRQGIWLKFLYVASLSLSLYFLVTGLYQPVNVYQAYIQSDNLFTEYRLKAAQVSQQRLIDGDLLNYQDLAQYLDDGSVVFYWGGDWIMPRLLLAGPHLPFRPRLIAIDTPDQLEDNLARYPTEKIFLLRGVDQMYLDLEIKTRPVRQEIFNGRSRFYVLLPAE